MRYETQEKIAWAAMWVMLALVATSVTISVMSANGNAWARKLVCESAFSHAPGYCFEYWYEKLKTK